MATGKQQVQQQVINRNPIKDKVENLPQDKLVENFVARHFKHILIFSMTIAAFSFGVSACAIHRYAGIITQQNQIIDNLSNKVIFVRPDGAVAVLNKQPINNDAVKYVLRDIALNLVPLDATDLQGVSSFPQLGNLYKVKQMLQYMTKSGLNGYKAYLDTIYSYYSAGKLPEYIDTFGYNSMKENIQGKDGQFHYTLSIPVYYTFVAPDMQWAHGEGTYTIEMDGKLDLPEGTPENPFGIRIEKFVVSKYISKPFLPGNSSNTLQTNPNNPAGGSQ